MMIDLADCDTMLPSVHDIRPALPFNAEQRPFMFNGAVLSLSILLGRILKGIYSPSEWTTGPAWSAELTALPVSWYHDPFKRGSCLSHNGSRYLGGEATRGATLPGHQVNFGTG